MIVRVGNIDYTTYTEKVDVYKKMDLSIAKYLSERKLKSAVILRSERNSDDWFMSKVGLNGLLQKFGKLVKIIDVDFEKEYIPNYAIG